MILNEIYHIFFDQAIHVVDKLDIIKKIKHSYKTNIPLTIKVGFDPTSSYLHVGHTILLKKLLDFQKLGHFIIFIIGDFTAQIGDPSKRDNTRPILNSKNITKNALYFYKQANKILYAKQTIFRFNSEWFSQIKMNNLIELLTQFSLEKILERTDFQKRFNLKKSIYLNELIYPLLQGYDSVIIKSDIEIGGTDQLFNLVTGRYIMKKFGIIPQGIITLPILDGTDGKYKHKVIIGKKMSKSFNNNISIADRSFIKFNKIMNIHDELMWKYYLVLYMYSTNNIIQLKKIFINYKYPKIQLAFNIISKYNTFNHAIKSFLSFKTMFVKQKKKFYKKHYVT